VSGTRTGPSVPPGRLVIAGRYRVLRTLGRGGMGSVVEVLDLKTDRLRALKLMRAELAVDASLRARFELEAMVAGRVESEHVIEVLDAGIDDATGSPYLVMELLRGDDLGALLKRDGPLTPERALAYLGQIAMGLDRTHADHVVHRDLKPENLFLAQRDDGSPRIKILDFGVAKVVATSGAQSTRSLGTPLYMAPEQLTGDGSIDARADLYALGHVAFALLSGAPYFTPEHERADNQYALALHMARGPSEPASARARARGVTLPDAIDPWFTKAVAPAVNDRFESASALVGALAAALALPTPPMRVEHDGPRPQPDAAPRDDAMTTPDTPSFATPTVAAAPITMGLDATPLRSPSSPSATSSTGVAIPSSRRGVTPPWKWLGGALAVTSAGVLAFLAFRASDDHPSSREERPTPASAAPSAAPSAPPSAPPTNAETASGSTPPASASVASPAPSPSPPSSAAPEALAAPASPRGPAGVAPPATPMPERKGPPATLGKPSSVARTPATPSPSTGSAGTPAPSPATRPTYDPLRDF
jgi:serine/threonine protein kinase